MNTDYLPISRGLRVLLNKEDFEELSRFKWCAVIRSGIPYAVRFVGAKALALHRVIMNAPDGLCVDHINHDSLDNRRENLRVCTRLENLRNRRSKRGVSQFQGVSPSLGKWRVDIAGRYVGTYSDEIVAAKAYDTAATEQYGQFANLNFTAGRVTP